MTYPQLGGLSVAQRSAHDEGLWVNNWIPGLDILHVEELTKAEVEIRKRMLITYDFFKENVPGFEGSFIIDSASQTGTRGSRRVIGEYMVTEKDINSGEIHENTISVCPQLRHAVSAEDPYVHIAYRSLAPRKVENLLVAGRSFSSNDIVNNDDNLIPHCIIYGQAAGTAAVLAIKSGVEVRNVDYGALKDSLVRQNIVLPE